MSKYKLSVHKTTHEGRIITTFGVKFTHKNQIRDIADISTDKVLIEQLIEKFNKYNLSVDHIDEAVENFLYDQCVD